MAKKKEQEPKKFNNPNVVGLRAEVLEQPITETLETNFMPYAMSVIMSRAIPEIDGFKPSHRKLLYTMYKMGLLTGARTKSANIVGQTMRLNPHGDAAIYDTMVRLSTGYQALLTPFVESKGNFGKVYSRDMSYAASRYTEAKLAPICSEIFRDIDRSTVDFVDNYDGSMQEPSLLPTAFPNVLVSANLGIAVGMASQVCGFNLNEVCETTIAWLRDPEHDIISTMPAPDFPTGGTIYGTAGIYEAYSTGRGRIQVRSKAYVEEEHHRIIITEIPYMVQKAELIKTMANLVHEKRIEGVTEIRDESGRDGLRVVVEYRKDANGQVILNQFYKYTQLQDTCSVIMLSLVGGEPKVLGLRQLLGVYIEHQQNVIKNRTKFDLDKALKEAHINEGYKIAIDNIDEVISIIRSSPDTPTARERLKERFALSDEQAQAIVQMTLGRLSGLERQKVENRLKELYASIRELRDILSHESRIDEIIKNEMLEIKSRFSDERRTAIEEVENEIMLEDLIERENVVITLTHEGYIKRQPTDTYSAQRRGGRGIIGMATKEEDYVERVVTSDSHSYLMLFTDSGKVHTLKAYRIPEAGRTAKGTNIINLIDITPEERITAIVSVPYEESHVVDGIADEEDIVATENDTLVMVTRGGVIKRTKLEEFRMQRKGGKIALSLDDGDKLIFVSRTHGESDILIATAQGLAARFNEDKVSVMGRSARGVRGISLREGDHVAGACIIERDESWAAENKLLVIADGGYGKRVSPDEFEAKGRGIQGMIIQKITDKTGEICSVAVCRDDEDVLMITNDGTMIRTPVDGIPVYGRAAAGVIVMKLAEESRIVNFALMEKEPEEEADAEEGETSDLEDSVEETSDEVESSDSEE